MSNVIVTTEEALRAIVAEAVAGVIPKSATAAPPPDTLAMPAAQQLLADHGYPTSRAKIYKLTSSNQIPHRKYGNKLVFSRRELLAWAEGETRSVGDQSEAVLAVSRSARRKK